MRRHSGRLALDVASKLQRMNVFEVLHPRCRSFGRKPIVERGDEKGFPLDVYRLFSRGALYPVNDRRNAAITP